LTEADVAGAENHQCAGRFCAQIQFNENAIWILEQIFRRLSGKTFRHFRDSGVKKLKDGRWLSAPLITRRIADGVLTFTPDASRDENGQARPSDSTTSPKKSARDNSKHSDDFFRCSAAQFFSPYFFQCVKVFAQSPFHPSDGQTPICLSRENPSAFFAPTAPDKPWTSGSFGCVRNDGWRMHEGIDIRHLQTDKRGEPTDPSMATAGRHGRYLQQETGPRRITEIISSCATLSKE